MNENNKKNPRPTTEKLTYNFTITNVENDLKTEIKNATLPFIKKFIDKMQGGLRTNSREGKEVSGKKTFSNKRVNTKRDNKKE